MKEKIKQFISKMNEKGIPVPMIRDPKTGIGSVTLTLVFISANVVLVSLLNSFANIFKGVDVANSLAWFSICLASYLGRKMQKDGNKIEIDEDK